MKASYDFSKGKKNPYAKLLKKQITLRVDRDVIEHFKAMSQETGVPYQSLMNIYLRDCLKKRRTIKLVPPLRGAARA